MKKEIVFTVSITSHLDKTGEGEYVIETQTGVNTFRCKVNEELFDPCSRPIFESPCLYGGYSNDFSVVRITAKCTEKYPYKYVIIELNNFKGAGDYLMSDTSNDCRYEEFYPDNTYKSTLTKKGKVTITKDDRVNFILAGSFEFVVANSANDLDIIIVSEGKFYLKF